MARPHGKFAVVDANYPVAFAQCDRCSKWRNRPDLIAQNEWAGTHLFDTGILVCKDTCYDTPNEQMRTIVLPPDPLPVINARPPNFQYMEAGPIQTTLTAFVPQGSTVLPVKSIDGFMMGQSVWVQLNNQFYGIFPIFRVEADSLVLASPLSFSAPPDGSVTVAESDGSSPSFWEQAVEASSVLNASVAAVSVAGSSLQAASALVVDTTPMTIHNVLATLSASSSLSQLATGLQLEDAEPLLLEDGGQLLFEDWT